MIITAESHLDHGLTGAQLSWLLKRFAGRESFFIETVTLPEELGTVPCGLYGPTAGDPSMANDPRATDAVRGDRTWTSRVVPYCTRETRDITVIAGPVASGAIGAVLYTAFGGPVTPQEPGDPSCKDPEASTAFWAEHVLATGGRFPANAGDVYAHGDGTLPLWNPNA